ncbi:LANO_0D02432g1_1 [Lachancea nothofagi CBS 11611]|uniref:Thiamine pyrophosphokinase n=1 Tax=Lachancea nothofagi CBS 11611 TaxID=1266666 RepID=A0A1G4JEA4_9SACH|nr:LANO_0D02432g1_1 [Lachancea nothofagi CBS 11611]
MEQVIENPESLKFEPPVCSHVLNLNKFLSPDHKDSALLILNQKITVECVFEKLWANYNLHVCADGGANQLYEHFHEEELRSKYVPDYIIGDLDSIRDEVLNFYLSHGVIVISQSWQYSTDFTKSLQLISLHFFKPEFRELLSSERFEQNYGIDDCHGIETLYTAERPNWSTRDIDMLVLNAIDGRFDQTVHSITQLYMTSRTDAYYKLCYLTSTDIIMLIPSGGTLIKYSKDFKQHCVKNCGLLPLGGPTVIKSTKGLKWDVCNWHTSIMGGKVSSSNRFVGESYCYFDVEDPLVLSIELTLSRLVEFI